MSDEQPIRLEDKDFQKQLAQWGNFAHKTIAKKYGYLSPDRRGDVAQEAMLLAWNQRATFDARFPFPVWYGFIIQQANSRIRRQNRDDKFVSIETLAPSFDDGEGGLDSVEELGIDATQENAVAVSETTVKIGRLRAKLKEVATLKARGHSQKEIAHELGISSQAVSARMRKVREKLSENPQITRAERRNIKIRMIAETVADNRAKHKRVLQMWCKLRSLVNRVKDDSHGVKVNAGWTLEKREAARQRALKMYSVPGFKEKVVAAGIAAAVARVAAWDEEERVALRKRGPMSAQQREAMRARKVRRATERIARAHDRAAAREFRISPRSRAMSGASNAPSGSELCTCHNTA